MLNRLFAVLVMLVTFACAKADTTLWTRAFYSTTNETQLKVDPDDNIYLAYVSGTPSFFTIKKISPDGVVLWSTSLPYQLSSTPIQLVLGPEDGDPYLGWVNGVSELRRFDRMTGRVRWKITPPMPKFQFSVYATVSVHGNLGTGAHVLTYSTAGQLISTSPAETGVAGPIWDGLISYDAGQGSVTERMLVRIRYANNGTSRLVIGDESYYVGHFVGALGVNTAPPISQIVIGGSYETSTNLGAIYEYRRGAVSSHSWPNPGPPYPGGLSPNYVRTSSREPFFAIVGNPARADLCASDGSAYNGWWSGTYGPTGAQTNGTFDHTGQLHFVRTKDGLGATLDDYTQLASSTYARSPRMEIDSRGHAIVSYIRQNGAPALVVSKVFLTVVAGSYFESTRRGESATWDIIPWTRGYDDGTEDPHFSIPFQPANGVATVSQTGKLTYTPNPGFLGDETVRYRVSKIGSSAEGQVTVFVKPWIRSFTMTDAPGGTLTKITITYDQAPLDSSGQGFTITTTPQYTLEDYYPVVTLWPGMRTASKNYLCRPVAQDRIVTAVAHGNNGLTYTTTFTVFRPKLVSLAMPSTIQGGNLFTIAPGVDGVVAWPSMVVTTEDNTPLIQTPASVYIHPDRSTGAGDCFTSPVASNTSCTVTATLDGISITKTITLLP